MTPLPSTFYLLTLLHVCHMYIDQINHDDATPPTSKSFQLDNDNFFRRTARSRELTNRRTPPTAAGGVAKNIRASSTIFLNGESSANNSGSTLNAASSCVHNDVNASLVHLLQ